MKIDKERDLQAYALLALPLTLLFFNPNFTDPFNLPKLLLLLTISSSVAIGFLIKSISKKIKLDYAGQKISLSLYILFLSIVIISGFVTTENIWRVMFGSSGRNNGILLYTAVVVLCVIIIVTPHNASNTVRVNRMIEYSGYLFILYCAVQWLGLDPVPWQGTQNLIVGTLGNPNFSAAALSAFALFFISQIQLSLRLPISRKVIYIAAVALSVFLSWKTDSIQGLVVFSFGLFLIVGLWIIRGPLGVFPKILYVSIISLTGIFIFLSFLGIGPAGNYLEQYTLKLRLFYISVGIQSMFANPLGLGVDSYLVGFREFRSIGFVREYGLGVLTDNAHSVPVQIGACFGIAAFVIFLIIFLRIFIKALSELLSTRNVESSLFPIYMFWIGLFLQSLLSIEQIGLGVLTWLLGAYILKYSASQAEVVKLNNSKFAGRLSEYEFLREVIVIAAVISMVAQLPIYSQDSARRNLLAIQVSPETSEEDRRFVSSEFGKLSGLTLSDPNLASPVLQKLFDVGDLAGVGRVAKELTEYNPQSFDAWNSYAIYLKEVREFAGYKEALERMIELDPVNYQAIWSLAVFLSEHDDIDKALNLAEKVILIDPNSPQSEEARAFLGQR